MAALLGKIDPFDPEEEEWPEYVERLGQYFEANDLLGNDKAAKRRATLISLMKPSTYRLARSLLSPAKPSEKTFDEIVAVLTKHYSPAPSEVMQRFRFNSRSRKAGESVATFVAELRSLAEFCNFGETLEKMLRDRLVSGINDEGIQKKLLAEHDLTYESALRIAQGSETASKNLQEMRQPSATPGKVKVEPVNRVWGRKGNGEKTELTCHRCGAPDHLADRCKFKDAVCHNCRKKGHLAKVCRATSKQVPSKPSQRKPKKQGSHQQQGRPVRQVEDESNGEESEDTLPEDQPIRVINAVAQGEARQPPIQYQQVFQEGLGKYEGYEAHLEVDPTATPRFCKARTLPYSMRKGAEEELARLVLEGTLEPVEYSDWATPIVAVLKSDRKSVRICGDFRMTVNPVSKLDRYPIPRIEDLFATLQGGKKFTKLDLSQAYQQLTLDEESKKYVVINTPKGLFRYTRLPYGVKSAPGIFQRVMENLLQGIPGIAIYIDDILITGEDDTTHLQSLEEVLRRLARVGLRAKRSKCSFMAASITYLGHLIDADGLHPLPEKIQALEQAPTPKNVSELKSYLGLLSYYGKFLPNLSTRLAPLYHLLGQKIKWNWTTAQETAFQESKKLLTSSVVLAHYDPKLPITLACDASAYGIGAVLSHRLPDGSEKPVGYASRTLNKAERNYSQLEKEGLACVFGVKRFYSYVFGHSFDLITDHKPLLGLLGEYTPTSPQAPARIRRWSIYLSMFEYTLEV